MTMDSAAAASSARGRSSTTVSTLFALLHQAEALGPAAKLFVRRRGGQTIGAIRLHAGRLVGLSGLGDHPSLFERLRARFPQSAPQLVRLWAEPGRGDAWDDALFAAGVADPAELRAGLLLQAAEELDALALQLGRDRPELLVISTEEPPRTQFAGFTALEVYLEFARGHDGMPEDSAHRLFRRPPAQAAAALLLLRPLDGTSLPVPLGGHGLDGASIHDVLPICLAAKALRLPPAPPQAGLPPEPTCLPLGEEGWVCIVGEHRLLALRASDPAAVERMLQEFRSPKHGG